MEIGENGGTQQMVATQLVNHPLNQPTNQLTSQPASGQAIDNMKTAS
jgi:hypothetical protein